MQERSVAARPTGEERQAKEYCKWHNSWRHSTQNCVTFRNKVQKAINEGLLLLPGKGKGVETLGPKINIAMVRPNFSRSLGTGKKQVKRGTLADRSGGSS